MRLCKVALFAIFLLNTVVPTVLAQSTKVEAPLPDAPVATAPERPYSRLDIFAGYSFLTVHGEIFGYKFSETHNAPIVGASYYITRNLGLEGQLTFSSSGSTDCFSSAQGGPVMRFFAGSQLSFFAHADVGETKMGIRNLQDCSWNPSVAAGGGLDYIFASTGNHLAIRLIQADYQYVRLNYNFLDVTGTTNVNVPRFSTGLTFRLEEIEPPSAKIPKSFECRTNPAEAYAGEQVVLAALANGYDFAKPYSIHWTSTGGTVVYPGPDVLLETQGLAPGSYVATAQLTHGKSSNVLASCNAPFSLKPPPSLTGASPGSPEAHRARDTPPSLHQHPSGCCMAWQNRSHSPGLPAQLARPRKLSGLVLHSNDFGIFALGGSISSSRKVSPVLNSRDIHIGRSGNVKEVVIQPHILVIGLGSGHRQACQVLTRSGWTILQVTYAHTRLAHVPGVGKKQNEETWWDHVEPEELKVSCPSRPRFLVV